MIRLYMYNYIVTTRNTVAQKGCEKIPRDSSPENNKIPTENINARSRLSEYDTKHAIT